MCAGSGVKNVHVVLSTFGLMVFVCDHAYISYRYICFLLSFVGVC